MLLESIIKNKCVVSLLSECNRKIASLQCNPVICTKTYLSLDLLTLSDKQTGPKETSLEEISEL